MSSAAPERKTWDAATKEKWANKILNGEVSFEQAQKELEVQPYQLYAWVGQQSLQKRSGDGDNSAPAENESDMRELIADGMAGKAHSHSEKAIVEWYIRKYIMGMS